MNDLPQKKQSFGLDLTNGDIMKLLLRFTIPLLLANFVQQLYNTVDMIVIGHFCGSIGTVGVSTGGDIPAVMTFVATSFGMAGQIYISQLIGAGDGKSIRETIGTLLSFMAVTSSICMAISIFFCQPMLIWMHCPQDAMAQAKNYMVIVSLGLPAVFGYNAVCGILRGMGESKRPLLFITAAAITNVFLDILLVAVIPMEAAGTAIATVMAEFASFAAACVFLYRNSEQFQFELRLRTFKMNWKHMKVLLQIGLPLTAQTAFIQFSQLICIAQINAFGMVAAATNSVGSKIHRFINIFTASLNGAAGAMVGQNLGAKKYDRIGKTVYASLAFSVVVGLFECAIAIFFPRQAFALFTKDPEVIEFGVVYMRIMIITFVLSTFQGPYMASVTGSGNTKLNFAAGMLDGVILRLGIGFWFAYGLNMGVVGFFYGNGFARLGPVLIGTIYFYSGKWRTRKLLFQEEIAENEAVPQT